MSTDNTKNPQESAENTSEETLFDLNTDENLAGTSHLNEAITDESEIEKLRGEVAEQKDKYLRLYADFDNFKRRSAKERLEYMQTAGKDVLISLLEVLDDAERAEKQLQSGTDIQQQKEGISLVFHKLRQTLQSRGLKPMETIGKEFNPDEHEAITSIPAPTEELKGKVVDEIEKGYLMNDRIIRFAKVVVGS
jgi:molecular chaperone GrpE